MSAAASDSTAELAPESTSFELLVTGDTGHSIICLPREGELLIGREEGADLRLTGSGVSRRHALLRIASSGLTLQDLGSSNGTLISGERADPNRELPLRAGQSIVLGDVVLVLRTRRERFDAAAQAGEVIDSGSERPACILQSRAMLALWRQTDPVARAPINVLILGETGVGKDVLARSIHDRSTRRTERFLRLNCAALPEQLLESELFGHEKGAFTGATRSSPGLLLATSGGTVFLDEVGELPPRLQAKLLQVVEAHEVRGIGAMKSSAIDVRFIAATNRDLEAEARTGAFRSDLYYRLAGFTAVIPPLRERRDDILPLAREFLRLARQRIPGASTSMRDEAAATLLDYTWPGNVRELRNVMERAVVLAEGRPLGPEHLRLDRAGGAQSAAINDSSAGGASGVLPVANLTAAEREERERIIQALASSSGNQCKAAELLGVSRSTLINRLDAYRIGRPRKRPG